MPSLNPLHYLRLLSMFYNHSSPLHTYIPSHAFPLLLPHSPSQALAANSYTTKAASKASPVKTDYSVHTFPSRTWARNRAYSSRGSLQENPATSFARVWMRCGYRSLDVRVASPWLCCCELVCSSCVGGEGEVWWFVEQWVCSSTTTGCRGGQRWI